MKGLPLTYNRDMQEDKEGLFDSIDTVKLSLATLAAMLGTLKPRTERMRQAASDPALMATDLAEWLVRHGVPFRDAHRQVGRFVGFCAANGIALDKATLAQMRESIPTAQDECLAIFDAAHSVAARKAIGGTASENVKAQIEYWKGRFAEK